MERLFSPRETVEEDEDEDEDEDEEEHEHEHAQFRDHFFPHCRERKLDVSIEEFLSPERAFTYTDLYTMLGNEEGDKQMAACLTPDAAVALKGAYFGPRPALAIACPRPALASTGGSRRRRPRDGPRQGLAGMSTGRSRERQDRDSDSSDQERCFDLNADDKEIVGWALSPEHLLEISDIVSRLLAASVVHSVILYSNEDAVVISAPSLSYLLEQCHSLKVLQLGGVHLDENHCRALGEFSRPDLEIELEGCRITDTGVRVLAQVLRRNLGPTKLDHSCCIDNCVLANVLRGNSRLKSLGLDLCTNNPEDGSRELLAIASALRENEGLVELLLLYDDNDHKVSDETWGAVCDSLKTHPTLEVLKLYGFFGVNTRRDPDVITLRTQVLANMMKVNTSIHTIHVDYLSTTLFSGHELFRGSVVPYLETNRLRPRLLAIQTSLPMAYRAKVLAEALLATRTDANSFWMLLSGNAEVVFPSGATTIAAEADLPTPATIAATSTAHAAAAVAASVISTLTTTATGGLPTAAAPAATGTTTPSTTSALDPTAAVAAANVARQKRYNARLKRKASP